jgi:probable F420-dependent oxidoreductase
VLAGALRGDHRAPTVDGREPTVRGVQEHAEQGVHATGHYVRLVRVDVMSLPQALRRMGAVATRTRDAGFDGLLFTEGGRTAFTAAAVAATAAPGLELSTGVAVAFPRSPMLSAQMAWELQEATDGHFRLGLGSQVRTHVVRRYGVPFEHPGPRLRDYVRAVKACFAAFRGASLDHRGDFYELTFLNAQWSPGPIDAPDPPVDVAAVNPWMLAMAGEVADGVHVHPLGEPGYLRRHVVPRVAEGAARAGRDAADVALIVPVITIVGDDDAEIAAAREAARGLLPFFGSTPNYAFVWDEAGFEGTTARIRERQKAGDLAGMAAQITDDHLAVFCTEATWDGLADALVDTYGDLATRLVLYNVSVADEERFARYGEVARAVRERTAG